MNSEQVGAPHYNGLVLCLIAQEICEEAKQLCEHAGDAQERAQEIVRMSRLARLHTNHDCS